MNKYSTYSITFRLDLVISLPFLVLHHVCLSQATLDCFSSFKQTLQLGSNSTAVIARAMALVLGVLGQTLYKQPE